jgi:hypothetical protein
MDETMVRKVRIFFAWQDEQEEAWLSEMARAGLHLHKYRGIGVYDFTRGEARNDAYRLDYITVSGKERTQYLQLFADAGWTHLGEMGGWQYFRKTVGEGEQAEIFSDNTSKIEKYRRVSLLYVLFIAIFIINLNNLNRREGWFIEGLTFLFFVMLMLFVVSLVKMFLRIEKLRKG